VEALLWVANNDFGFGPLSTQAKAIVRLQRDHLQSDKLGPLCQKLGQSLSYQENPAHEAFLRTVLAKNSHKKVQGIACLALAQAIAKRAGADQKLAKEAEALFERAADKYGDVKLEVRNTVGEQAKNELFSLRFLSIGKTPPDIQGKDHDEVAFKLTDYRGKVVLLDFWGNW
jgi:hypothetical protein